MERTADSFNQRKHLLNGQPLEKEDISLVIQQRAAKNDDLHKVIRTLYLKKTKAVRH
ncbi:hypothetical protein [Viridibacillus arvi]|uniref:hypothetical protein n=1 Tax=Viridibacillus arvi TaxID=263475 RepID=UPI0012ED531C|nr:hypothetical protein [Viridibacillus arvi]